MRSFLFATIVLVSFAGWAQNTPSAGATVYPNIDDQTTPYNWTICNGSCAGGARAQVATFSLDQAQPALDGASTKFYVQGKAWTDVLFYHHLGANDAVANFQTDFWFQLDNNSTLIGQAFEFDTYQFLVNLGGVQGLNSEFMFGTQCDYGQYGGVWDIWDQLNGHWIPIPGMPCVNPSQNHFRPNVWYHVTWNFDRLAPTSSAPYGQMSFNSVHVVGYAADNTNITSDYTYNINTIEPAGPLPSGWGHQMGVQFQIDLNGKAHTKGYPSSITEWADEVTLTVW